MDINNGVQKAFILYEKYYDFNNNRVLSGGVQTYIFNLIPILNEAGYSCIICQCAKKRDNRKIKLDNNIIVNVPGAETNSKYNYKILLKYIEKYIDKSNDLLIFADHRLVEKNNIINTISIQHGIHWDIPKIKSRNSIRMLLSKARFLYNLHKRMNYVKQVVCVDYNFLNWYRAQVDVPSNNITVIKSFTKIASIFNKPEDKLKIIFARRFVKHRGTRIFVEVAEKLLSEYKDIEITIAGRGPDESYFQDKLGKWKERVKILQYNSEESLRMHADKHIAVIPTIGSEGISLSLLEAMSAQCAVVCTNVGGMTNVVLDGYNGVMVNAGNSEQLYIAIKYLIDNPDDRKRIALAGYETVKYAFSYDRWACQWRKVINNIKNINT